MANSKKNPAVAAPFEAPAPFEDPTPVEIMAPAEIGAPIEAAADPIAAAAAFAEAKAAEAPIPAPAASPDVAKMLEAPARSITEMQERLRAMIEKGISQTRDNFTKAKSAADEANSALEASFKTAKTGVAEINAKALDALRASADANFDFVKSVLGVKSVADYVTLHSEFARKQIETLTGQTRELTALAQKVATESAEPIKTQVAKTFKIAS